MNKDPNDEQSIININPEVITINLLQIDVRCQHPKEFKNKFDVSPLTPYIAKQVSRETYSKSTTKLSISDNRIVQVKKQVSSS